MIIEVRPEFAKAPSPRDVTPAAITTVPVQLFPLFTTPPVIVYAGVPTSSNPDSHP
jgi:hypothetical protein